MTFDLSAITDALIDVVKNNWASAPLWTELGGPPTFTPAFTGLAPDAIRSEGDAELSLFLYHVEPDNATESLFWRSEFDGTPSTPATRFLPTTLHLYYLLSAYSQTSYSQEQQAMSIALRLFHGNPVVFSPPGSPVQWRITLTMEHRSYDELSRLWQATTTALRMSVVYRAAVVFVPPDPPPATPPLTTSYSVVAQQVLSGAVDPQSPTVLGTYSAAGYVTPDGNQVEYNHEPAVVAAGQRLEIVGARLGGAATDRTFLVVGTTEVDVTGWTDNAASSPTRRVLRIPAPTDPALPSAPQPGIYQVRLGHGTTGTSGYFRTDPVPVSVAAYVDASHGATLAGAAPYVVGGSGFAPGHTDVFVGANSLSLAADPPGPGQFSVGAGGTSLSVNPPSGLSGLQPLRVRVAGVDSDPVLWVSA